MYKDHAERNSSLQRMWMFLLDKWFLLIFEWLPSSYPWPALYISTPKILKSWKGLYKMHLNANIKCIEVSFLVAQFYYSLLLICFQAQPHLWWVETFHSFRFYSLSYLHSNNVIYLCWHSIQCKFHVDWIWWGKEKKYICTVARWIKQNPQLFYPIQNTFLYRLQASLI